MRYATEKRTTVPAKTNSNEFHPEGLLSLLPTNRQAGN
jgi:hypothetical protein